MGESGYMHTLERERNIINTIPFQTYSEEGKE